MSQFFHLSEVISKNKKSCLSQLTHTNISNFAEKRRKGKLNSFTHTGNGKWQTGRQKAASVSIYSSAGDDKEAGVRVNILCGTHSVV